LASKYRKKVRCICGNVMELRSKHLGRRVRCPKCERVFRAPGKRIDSLEQDASPLIAGPAETWDPEVVQEVREPAGQGRQQAAFELASSADIDREYDAGEIPTVEAQARNVVDLDAETCTNMPEAEEFDLEEVAGNRPVTPPPGAVIEIVDSEEEAPEIDMTAPQMPQPQPAQAPVSDQQDDKLEVPAEDEYEEGFWDQVPRAFAWPFRGTGVFIVVFLSLFVMLAHVGCQYCFYAGLFGMIAGMLGLMMLAGYLSSFALHLTRNTCFDVEATPNLPGFEDRWESIFRPAFMMVCLYLASAVPLYVWGMLHYELHILGDVPFYRDPIFIAAVLLGLVYLPMGYAAMAALDGIGGLNPVFVVRSIMAVPVEYVAAYVLAVLVLIIGCALQVVLPYAFVSLLRGGYLLPRFLGSWLAWAVNLYMIMVIARVMGLLVNRSGEKLGWL